MDELYAQRVDARADASQRFVVLGQKIEAAEERAEKAEAENKKVRLALALAVLQRYGWPD